MAITISEFRKNMARYMRELPVELMVHGRVVAIVSQVGDVSATKETVFTGLSQSEVSERKKRADESPIGELIQKSGNVPVSSLAIGMCSCGRFEAETDGLCMRCKRG